ncbi:hypothetical protein MTR67_003980 [Solanum verrucosum]|uniref:Reverse transcriptase zinc-binding domain-containing protein n=1 Tax=Solanum verrucosum TaxID=315347 RepID=A0AAF0PVC3_SOLVR|nr:hypothetical protein MTR67_003980 [Solanum verrucosum]
MAFIKNRQIMDAILIANEVVDSRISQGKAGILCKLDIEKAYDHVNWEYLLKILTCMGFGRKWIKRVRFCISTVKFSVLINGAPEIFFPVQRGVSGLHINWRKSMLFPINEVTNIEELSRILRGEVGALPTSYLGMPLGAKSNSMNIWSSVMEKCEKKLSRWKSHYLSLGGRVTLINSVLDALPTYMMSIFLVPDGIIQRLDKSKALRLKWLWRYSQEPQAYWSKVIKIKYGEEDRWMTKEVNTPYGVSVWRSIRVLWPFMKKHTNVKVGNGHKSSFWKDNWLRSDSLKHLFPDLAVMAVQPEVSVSDTWTQQGWNIHFRRNFNDWEIDSVIEFFRMLEEFKGTSEEKDRLWWKLDSKGSFKVNSAYKFLNQGNLQRQHWPWKHIWKIKIPFKVVCFTWLLAREAVLTQENLKKRKFSLCSRLVFQMFPL